MLPAASSPDKASAPGSTQAASQLATWQSQVLSDAARRFVADLARRFDAPIAELLARRVERRKRIASGTEGLGFLAETAQVRARDWRVAPTPHDLQRRAVE